MLTRAGVAKRLGKSIATVRRMEGIELHATLDSRGVHLFDEREVEAIADPVTRRTQHSLGVTASGSRAQRLADRDFDWTSVCSDARGSDASHAAEARTWAEQARVDATAIRDERSRLERARHAEFAALAKASQELDIAKRMLILELEDCDERILRRLTDQERAEIVALLDE